LQKNSTNVVFLKSNLRALLCSLFYPNYRIFLKNLLLNVIQ
jgi:hypothetical protein